MSERLFLTVRVGSSPTPPPRFTAGGAAWHLADDERASGRAREDGRTDGVTLAQVNEMISHGNIEAVKAVEHLFPYF